MSEPQPARSAVGFGSTPVRSDFELLAARPSIFSLIRQVPSKFSRLLKTELQAVRAEVSRKADAARKAATVAAVGGVLTLGGFGAIIAAGTAGLATVMPTWLAALIVGGGLLVIGGVVLAVGAARMKSGLPLTPRESLAKLKGDFASLKGAQR